MKVVPTKLRMEEFAFAMKQRSILALLKDVPIKLSREECAGAMVLHHHHIAIIHLRHTHSNIATHPLLNNMVIRHRITCMYPLPNNIIVIHRHHIICRSNLLWAKGGILALLKDARRILRKEEFV